MTTASFTLIHDFHSIPLKVLRGFYEDITRMKAVHPLIIEVSPISISDLKTPRPGEFTLPDPAQSDVKQGDSYGKAYRITDSLSLVPFLPSISLEYDTVCILDTPDAPDADLVFAVFPNGYIRMENYYKFTKLEGGKGCRLEENVTVTGPGWMGGFLASYTATEAEKAHKGTFKKLEELYGR
jgi:hypothetical protein